MGHTLVALAQQGADPVHKVSIIPRGIGALGYTIQRPTEDRYLMTRPELEQRIARDMVLRYGMSEEIGFVSLDPDQRSMLHLPHGMPAPMRPVSEATLRQVDHAIRAIMMAGFASATHTLERNRALLERAAGALLKKETLDAADIRQLAAEIQLQASPTPDPHAAAHC